jgi:hypothetical protein
MTLRDEVTQAAAEVLEPNLQFYRKDPNDSARYFVGPEVVKAIAWAATTIALPIMLSAVNEVVQERVKEWLKNRKNKADGSSEPPASIQSEIASLLESKGAITILKEQVPQAIDAVTDYLSIRGWPKPLAKSDAVRIVEVIRVRVEKKS